MEDGIHSTRVVTAAYRFKNVRATKAWRIGGRYFEISRRVLEEYATNTVCCCLEKTKIRG
jgi:hypothetical protein